MKRLTNAQIITNVSFNAMREAGMIDITTGYADERYIELHPNSFANDTSKKKWMDAVNEVARRYYEFVANR